MEVLGELDLVVADPANFTGDAHTLEAIRDALAKEANVSVDEVHVNASVATASSSMLAKGLSSLLARRARKAATSRSGQVIINYEIEANKPGESASGVQSKIQAQSATAMSAKINEELPDEEKVAVTGSTAFEVAVADAHAGSGGPASGSGGPASGSGGSGSGTGSGSSGSGSSVQGGSDPSTATASGATSTAQAEEERLEAMAKKLEDSDQNKTGNQSHSSTLRAAQMNTKLQIVLAAVTIAFAAFA